MVEYLQGTARKVVALKPSFIKNATVIYLTNWRGCINFLKQKMFCYEYLVYLYGYLYRYNNIDGL